MPQAQGKSDREFWTTYLLEHQHPLNRGLHFLGTTLALATAVSLAYLRLWWWVPIAIPVGYFFAWLGHFSVERNFPSTFRSPIRAFLCDWRLWWKMLDGSLLGELERARTQKPSAAPIEKFRKAA